MPPKSRFVYTSSNASSIYVFLNYIMFANTLYFGYVTVGPIRWVQVQSPFSLDAGFYLDCRSNVIEHKTNMRVVGWRLTWLFSLYAWCSIVMDEINFTIGPKPKFIYFVLFKGGHHFKKSQSYGQVLFLYPPCWSVVIQIVTKSHLRCIFIRWCSDLHESISILQYTVRYCISRHSFHVIARQVFHQLSSALKIDFKFLNLIQILNWN